MSGDITGHWKGKIPFEDYVSNRLWSIDETAKEQLEATQETNRLLSEMIGKPAKKSKPTKKKSLRKNKITDILDDVDTRPAETFVKTDVGKDSKEI